MGAPVLDEEFGWNVIDALPGAIAVFDPSDGMILFTNRAWDRLFDYEPGSLVGRPIAVVNAPGEPDPSEVAAEIIEATRALRTWQGTIHNVRRSGQEFWTHADITTVRDPELGDLLVTMQAEVRAAGTTTERHPLDVFEELAHIGTWELDLVERSVHCSAQMLRLHGVTPEFDQVPVARLLQLVHPDDRHLLIEAFEGIVRDVELPQLEYRVLHPDGAVRHLVIRGAPIDLTGPRRRFGGVAIDVTEAHEREGELAAALDREQDATASLRSADELKDLFLRALSHDLRTPLTIMQGFAHLIATRGDDLPSDERRDYAERIGRSAERLHQQLTDLLDLDRLSRGVLDPFRQTVELRKLLTDVVEALDLATRVRVLGEPIVASVDAGHVERIVENLVANAARHAPPESRIEVRCEPVRGGVLLVVEDDGPGIPDSLKEHVFNVFVKASPMSQGSGVGLSLVRRFAELQGGRAWVEDRPGGGSSFRVFLPAP